MANIGDEIQIHSYKHDGSIHRIWEKAVFVDETAQCVVLANEKTRVLESNGKSWFTKEPAVCFFFKQHWFNVICMLKEDGIHYYCNIGSPFTIDEEALKYVDYDLDIKVFPDMEFKVLDKFEYQANAKEMGYSEDIRKIIKYEMANLKERIKEKEEPFHDDFVMHYLGKFHAIVK